MFVRLALFPGATREDFERLAAAMPDGPAPEGRLLFAAGAVPTGWQVVQVWNVTGARACPPHPPVVTDFEPSVMSLAVVD